MTESVNELKKVNLSIDFQEAVEFKLRLLFRINKLEEINSLLDLVDDCEKFSFKILRIKALSMTDPQKAKTSLLDLI